MANQIGSIPEFTDNDAPSEGLGSEVSVSSTDKIVQPETIEEKDIPSDPPAEQTPAENIGEDTGALEKQELENQLSGLRKAKRDLILELNDLRGDKREAKQEEVKQVQAQIDDLKDLNTQDVETIDRILKAKGYVSQQSVNQMFYQNRKQEEVSKFLNEFREYNEDNDPDGKKFGPLLQEMKLYKEPQDPSMYGILLRRAHKTLNGTVVSSERPAVKQFKAQIAGVGSGGSQRSSSVKAFSQEKKQRLKDGGWSEEDIERMEQR
jgi:hypothetical protein